MKVINMYFEL